jgi:lipopolysaccharide export system ATP-binding protein
MAQLIASNLAKAYRGREVVQDVSLQIDSGQIVGLLGPNGAGKTTCFYMIIGIIRADRGTITVNDEDITARSMHERARRGVATCRKRPLFSASSPWATIFSLF